MTGLRNDGDSIDPPIATACFVRGLVGALVFVRVGAMFIVPLMDTTEARYAEIARKMVQLNDWVTPWFDYGIPYWGKPPLSFWLTAISFQVFGISEFSARLPHFIASSATVILVAWMAHRREAEATWPAIGCIVGAPLLFISSGAVLTDMELTLGSTLTMAGFWIALEEGSSFEPRLHLRLLATVLFVGGLTVGMLAKGPVSWLIIFVPIFLWTAYYSRWRDMLSALPFIPGICAAVLISLPWYLLAERHTPGFLQYFFVGEHFHRFVSPGWRGDLYGNAHPSPVGAIWLFSFVDLLPWTVLLPIAAWRWHKPRPTRDALAKPTSASVVTRFPDTLAAAISDLTPWQAYLILWAFTPLVLFTPARNVGWTYILPGMPAAALLASQWMAAQGRQGRNINRLLTIGLSLTVCLVSAAAIPWLVPNTMERKSAKALLAAYASAQSGQTVLPAANLAEPTPSQARPPLIFVHRRPFSAQFYTGGRAILVRNASEAWSRIGRGSAYVAISSANQFMSAGQYRPANKERNDADGIHDDRSGERNVRRIGRYGNFDLLFVEAL